MLGQSDLDSPHETLRVEWRNSTPWFVLLPERAYENNLFCRVEVESIIVVFKVRRRCVAAPTFFPASHFFFNIVISH